MSESKTSKRRLTAADRQLKALELRKAGKSYPAIAAELGWAGPSGAYRSVSMALKNITREPSKQLVELEVQRLDDLLGAVWGKAMEGDGGAIDRALRIMERR